MKYPVDSTLSWRQSNNHNHISAPLSYCSCCPPMWPNHFPFLLCFTAHAAYFIFLFLFHFRKLSFLLISSFYHAKNTVAHLFPTSFPPFSVVSMSGSAMLYGLLHCQNSRYIHPSKPRTITFDCKLYLGRDDESNVCIMMGVLHFFVPVNLPAPIDNRPYLVCRWVASVNDKMNIGEDAGDCAGYDIEIDTIFVSPFTFYTKFF